MAIPRLTEDVVRRAESADGSKVAGWFALCSKGYLPAEIAVFSEKAWASDVRTRVRQYAEDKQLPIPASCARTREPREHKPVADWREAFRATVMRTGLNLALTQPMLEHLCATADGVMWDRFGTSSLGRPDNWLATEQSLTKRGLIRRRVDLRSPSHGTGDSVCELTEAGTAVIALLKCTGIFVEADRSIERQGGKGGGR
jgi:hypothetical protein